jgi:hypothetical protein
VAEGRARWRSPWPAWRAFAPLPRAPARSSDPCGGAGASQEVTPQRGLAPAAIPAAVTLTRPGWAHAVAASAQASERRLGGAGARPGHAPRRAAAGRGGGPPA